MENAAATHTWLPRLGRAALRVLVPEWCAVCGSEGAPLCASCRTRLQRIGPPWCARCGAPCPWPVSRCADCTGRRLGYAAARSAVVYDAHAARLVAGWKEGGQRGLAAVAASIVAEVIPRPAASALICVPADPERRLERGHAPPEALARALGGRWQLPVRGVLRRTGACRRQRGLTRAERRGNVRGAFRAADAVSGTVVLVDDVFTTGETTSACARELRRAGASRVEVVTFARSLR